MWGCFAFVCTFVCIYVCVCVRNSSLSSLQLITTFMRMFICAGVRWSTNVPTPTSSSSSSSLPSPMSPSLTPSPSPPLGSSLMAEAESALTVALEKHLVAAVVSHDAATAKPPPRAPERARGSDSTFRQRAVAAAASEVGQCLLGLLKGMAFLGVDYEEAFPSSLRDVVCEAFRRSVASLDPPSVLDLMAISTKCGLRYHSLSPGTRGALVDTLNTMSLSIGLCPGPGPTTAQSLLISSSPSPSRSRAGAPVDAREDDGSSSPVGGVAEQDVATPLGPRDVGGRRNDRRSGPDTDTAASVPKPKPKPKQGHTISSVEVLAALAAMKVPAH